MILLDTSAVVDLAGKKEWIVKIVDTNIDKNFLVSVISIGEIKIGRLLSKNKNEAVFDFLNRLINQPQVDVVDVDQKVAGAFAQIQSQLLAKGLPLSPLDGLIAATAQVYKASLATSDGDFKRVKNLKLITP